MSTYWQSLAAPWRQRTNARTWWSLVAQEIPLLLIGLLIMFIGEFSQKSMVASALALLMMTTHGFWMLQVAGMVQLNQPACVLLVPRYLQVQRRALLALWLALALVQTVAFVAARALGLTNLVDSPALWLLACAAGLLFWALAIRWGLMVGSLFLLTPLWLRPFGGWVEQQPWSQINWVDAGQYANGWVVPLLVAMGWMLSRTALRRGDSAHRAQVARNAKLLAALQDENPADAYRLSDSASKGIAVLQTPFRCYASWLLALPRSGPSHALAKAELGLGARTHWVMQVANTGAILLALILVACGYELVWGNAWETFSNPITILGLGVITFVPLASWRIALRLTTKEQALMLLLPSMPQGTDLNRALAKRHLRHLFVSWLAMAALAVFLPWPSAIRSDALLLAVVSLPLIPMAIQDWSRVAVRSPWQWLTVVLAGPVWISVALIALHLYVSMYWLATLSLVAFAVTTGWRWKKLSRFAQAFPVGQRV